MEPDVQQQYPDLAEEHASGPSAERQIALTRCFQHLDVDGSGWVDVVTRLRNMLHGWGLHVQRSMHAPPVEALRTMLQFTPASASCP